MKKPPSFLVRDGETTIIKMAAPDLVGMSSIMLTLCVGLMAWSLFTPEISGGIIGAFPLALACFYAMFVGLPLGLAISTTKPGTPIGDGLILVALCGWIPLGLTIYLVGWYRRMHRLLASIHATLLFEDGQWFVQEDASKHPVTLGPVKAKTGQHDTFSGLHWSLMTAQTPTATLLFDPANMIEQSNPPLHSNQARRSHDGLNGEATCPDKIGGPGK